MSPAKWLLCGLVSIAALALAWLGADLGVYAAYGEPHTFTGVVRAWSTTPRVGVVCFLAGFGAGAGGIGLVWHFWG
jgi:hypothetical protein